VLKSLFHANIYVLIIRSISCNYTFIFNYFYQKIHYTSTNTTNTSISCYIFNLPFMLVRICTRLIWFLSKKYKEKDGIFSFGGKYDIFVISK